MQGSKISNAPENNSFALSFMHLKLRREFKEGYSKMGESEEGLCLKMMEIMCSHVLERGGVRLELLRNHEKIAS